MVIAHNSKVKISAIAIDGYGEPLFFDAVNTFPSNDVYDVDDIWGLIDLLQDIHRSTENWESWEGWEGTIPEGSCDHITEGTDGLDVTAKQGYVLSLTLWWFDPEDVGELSVEDQNHEIIPFIPPTSAVGERPYTTYFYIDSTITTIYIYACMNLAEASKNMAPGIQYDLELNTKNGTDFSDEWMVDPYPSTNDGGGGGGGGGGEIPYGNYYILYVIIAVTSLITITMKKLKKNNL